MVSLLYAAQIGGTDPSRDFFYTITHLNALVYLFCFIIFVLSILNLIFQGWISLNRWPFITIRKLVGENIVKRLPYSHTKPEQAPNPNEEGVIGVKPSFNADGRVSKPRILTPLDGVNHPIPQFASNNVALTGAPRILSNQKKPAASEFKFSSAVDVPSVEELQRRGKISPTQKVNRILPTLTTLVLRKSFLYIGIK